MRDYVSQFVLQENGNNKFPFILSLILGTKLFFHIISTESILWYYNNKLEKRTFGNSVDGLTKCNRTLKQNNL